jgi:hypothetical protein
MKLLAARSSSSRDTRTLEADVHVQRYGEHDRRQIGGTMRRATTGTASQENQVTEDLIGENRLWTAVILNAIDDWRYGTLRARREAQTYLFEDHADFENVCARARLDAESFRGKLLKIGRRIEMEAALTRIQAALSPVVTSQRQYKSHQVHPAFLPS